MARLVHNMPLFKQRKHCHQQTQDDRDDIEPKAYCFPTTFLFLPNSLAQLSLALFGQVPVGERTLVASSIPHLEERESANAQPAQSIGRKERR